MERSETRVLLVEDDRLLRKAAEAMLRRRGYTVLVALDGEEALRVARAEGPHVILLDMIMPKLQGFEVLRALKEDPTTQAIPVVVLSSLTQEDDRQRAIESGAAAYVRKTELSLQDLAGVVESALRGGTR